MKRFAPPPVRLQIEKQLASQECASNTEKVWQLIGNLARPDIKQSIGSLCKLHSTALPCCNKHYNGFFQCGYVNIQEDNSLIVIVDCVHEFKRNFSAFVRAHM